MEAQHFIQPNDPSKAFNKADYYANPKNYHSVFAEKVQCHTAHSLPLPLTRLQYAPYVSVIMNCMYWDIKYPRMITIKQMEEMTEKGNTRLLAVGDISCDRMVRRSRAHSTPSRD